MFPLIMKNCRRTDNVSVDTKVTQGAMQILWSFVCSGDDEIKYSDVVQRTELHRSDLFPLRTLVSGNNVVR